MTDRLEPDIALLNVAGGRPLTAEPPGLVSFTPPRKAARGRERDVLLLSIALRARSPLPAEQAAERQAALAQLAAAAFYGAPGSVTAAARQALMAVNQRLLEDNLRDGAPQQGGLICAVLRGRDFYAVLSGPGSLLVAHPAAVERFASPASRPLGLSDVLDAQYFHTQVDAGDYLVLSQTAQWTETSVAGLGSLGTTSAVAERLREAGGLDFTALLARLEPEGTLETSPAPAPLPAGGPGPNARASAPAGLAEWLRRPADEGPSAEAPDGPSASAEPEPEVATGARSLGAGASIRDLVRRADRADRAGLGSAPGQAAEDEPTPFVREAEPGWRLPAGPMAERAQAGLRSFGRAVGVTVTETARGLRRLIARALPEGTLQQDGMLVLPTSVQIGIAIGMPLLIVAIVAAIYIQRGQAQEYEDALQAARVAVAQGRLAADASVARQNWEAALVAAGQAERVRANDSEITQLRLEAQARLDDLDGVTRVEYVPLVPGGFGPQADLTRITLIGRDVYALDAGQQRVWRLAPNASGVYSRDESFECSSGVLGPLTIGPLVDIGFVAAPNVRDSDALVALDNAGALLYCAPGGAPLGSYLPAPGAGWAQPTAIELYGDSLYVLDIGQNQVWQLASSGGVFNQAPTGYFGGVVYDLSDVVDFTIAGGDLLLLRRDGRISMCTRTPGLQDASCVERALFTDPRPGRASGDQLADLTQAARLYYDQPPEPSVFALNPERDSLFQLSLKLVFTRQFQPVRALGAPITALAIDPAKRFFITTRDNVYVAVRP